MKIDNFAITPLGNVPGPRSGSFREREESIHRILLAHQTLSEVRYDIVRLTDIKWQQGPSNAGGNFPFFSVERGTYYDAVRDAVGKGLVWCTDINAIDYPFTIARWKDNMRTMLSPLLVTHIESNDLTLPQFEDFKVMYTLYLISATRTRNGQLLRHPDFVID